MERQGLVRWVHATVANLLPGAIPEKTLDEVTCRSPDGKQKSANAVEMIKCTPKKEQLLRSAKSSFAGTPLRRSFVESNRGTPAKKNQQTAESEFLKMIAQGKP